MKPGVINGPVTNSGGGGVKNCYKIVKKNLIAGILGETQLAAFAVLYSFDTMAYIVSTPRIRLCMCHVYIPVMGRFRFRFQLKS